MTPSNRNFNDRSMGNKPDADSNGKVKHTIEEEARNAKREMEASAREKAQSGQKYIVDGADALSDAVDAAAASLDDHDREGLARYARELSGNLADAAGHLEGRSVDELANDAKRLARNNPALFMLGSIAVGFGLSRFFKADAERDQHDSISTGAPMQENGHGMGTTHMRATSPGLADGRELS